VLIQLCPLFAAITICFSDIAEVQTFMSSKKFSSQDGGFVAAQRLIIAHNCSLVTSRGTVSRFAFLPISTFAPPTPQSPSTHTQHCPRHNQNSEAIVPFPLPLTRLTSHSKVRIVQHKTQKAQGANIQIRTVLEARLTQADTLKKVHYIHGRHATAAQELITLNPDG